MGEDVAVRKGLFVFPRVCIEPGKIDEDDKISAHRYAFFEGVHRDAMPISDVRPRVRHAVEEGGLARIGRPHEQDHVFQTRTPSAISRPSAIRVPPAPTTYVFLKGETL